MKIEKLKVGMIIKNYKLLCEILEMEISAGNTKKAQLKELERFIKYHKEGNKFIIDEIYDKPKDKIENRGKDHSIYSKFIQKLILDLLVQRQKDDKKNIYLSTCKLLESLNMINENYTYCKNNMVVLADFLKMSEDCVYDFYNTTYGNLKNTLESALNILSNKALIIWNTVLTVSVNIKIINDKDEEIYIERHRPATVDEKEFISTIEKKILIQMGFENKRDIVICKKWKEYMKNVNKILKQETDINYYYKSYDIVFNKYIKKEQQKLEQYLLKNKDRKATKDQLNNTLVDRYKQNGEKRHNNTIEKTKVSFGKPRYSLKEETRIDENYIKNNNKLVDTLIDGKQQSIRYEMNKSYRNNKEKMKKQFDNFLNTI